MTIVPDAIYVKRKLPRIKLTFDKKGKSRPAWIWVKGISGKRKAVFLRIRVGKLKRLEYYRTYLSPRLPLYIPVNYTSDEMQLYYNKFSEIYDKHIIKNNLPAAKFLVSKLKIPKNAKILDLGAGTGIASEQLVLAGYKNITLVDFSEKMLAKAKKKKLLKDCKFVRQDVRKLKLKDKFDLINFLEKTPTSPNLVSFSSNLISFSLFLTSSIFFLSISPKKPFLPTAIPTVMSFRSSRRLRNYNFSTINL
jgi:hypothetical protein